MAIPGTIQFPALAATPSPPPVGSYLLYVGTSNTIFLEDSNGVVYPFGATNFISSLTGDVTASGPGAAAATVVAIQGSAISVTPPSDAQMLIWNASSGKWTPSSLSGDVTTTNAGVTTVNSVGGSSATNINLATIAANAATNLNTASTIVKRDASGNFSASTITANLIGNASGSAGSFTGSLSGDVTGTQSATSIASTVVTSKLLTGLVAGTSTPILATDSILIGFEKLQAQVSSVAGSGITALTGDVSATGPGSAAATVNSVGGASAASIASTVTNAVLGNPNLTSPGAITFVVSAGTITQDPTKLFWDSTNSRLTIGANGTNTPARGNLYLVNPDPTTLNFGIYGETNNATPNSGWLYQGRRSHGPALVGSGQVQNGDGLVQVTGNGWDGSGNYSGGSGAIGVSANENWTSTAHGSLVFIQATQNGTTVKKNIAFFASVPSTGNAIMTLLNSGQAQGISQTWNGTTGYTVIWPAAQGATGTALTNSDGAGTLTWVAYANATLSNLTGPTSINQNLLFSAALANPTISSQNGSLGFASNSGIFNFNGTGGTTINLSTGPATVNAAASDLNLNASGNIVIKPTSGAVAVGGPSSSTTALTVNTTSFIVDSTNNAIGIGVAPSGNAVIDVVNASGTTKAVQLTGYGSNVGVRGRYANGTVGTPTAALTGNILEFISGRGYGTTAFAAASTGAMNITAGGTFTDTSMPTYISFNTTPSGSVTSAERIRINSTGNILIGTTTDNATDQLQLSAGIISSYQKFAGATSGYVQIKAPSVVTTYTLTLPATTGSAGQVPVTDGSGNLGWTNIQSNIDGGVANSVYTTSQFIEGGTP